MSSIQQEAVDPAETVRPEFHAGPQPEDWPLERLEQELISWAGHLAAATARWLIWLAAYDRREGWRQWECRSAAQWLSWKCGMSLHTARAHVRVARALEELPVVAASFSAGELSYSKVRALTRLARPFDEEQMVEFARTTTASHLDRTVTGCREAIPPNGDLGQRDRVGARGGSTFRWRPRTNGDVELTVRMSHVEAEQAEATIDALIDRMLEERASGISVEQRVADLGGWDAIRAMAAVALLTATSEPLGPDAVEIRVEAEAVPAAAEPEPSKAAHGLATDGDQTGASSAATKIATTVEVEGRLASSGRHLPPSVIRWLGCDAVIATERPFAASGGEAAVGVGRRTRVVPRWLRRRLERRDKSRCQFPGCASGRRLHAHHIVHWLDGGPTELDNLILLCSFHHHRVHEGGWMVTGSGSRPTFHTPDGSPAPVPTLSGDPGVVQRDEEIGASALLAFWAGERFDLDYIVHALANNALARSRRTSPPEN